MEADLTNFEQRWPLNSALCRLHGSPFWWRDWLDDLKVGLEQGHVTPRAGVERLADMHGIAMSGKSSLHGIDEAEIRKGLEEHYETVLHEVFEFAELHDLPLARQLREQNSPPPSHHRSR